MEWLIILSFVIGYLLIVFEHPLKLDKAIPALFMGIFIWTVIALNHMPLIDASGDHGTTEAVTHHLGKITEILLFLLGAMTIVEAVDAHHGFSVITNRIRTKNKTHLLWIISGLAFILSSILDNLTTTIVLVSLLRKLIYRREERIWFVAFVVIAANAGGAWSPIGDVTTTMLWIAGKVSSMQLIVNLIIPSILCLVIPLLVASRMKVFNGNLEVAEDEEEYYSGKSSGIQSSKIMLIAGVGALVFVPIFKSVTHLPPWMGVMFGLGIVWLVSEFVEPEIDLDEMDRQKYTLRHALSRVELSSILFFLGILLAINGLESLGILKNLAVKMDALIPSQDLVATLIGVLSAIIDNVPLVAAAIGMYSVPLDHELWHFIAFSAGTGGSMLVIGSAAGVAAMGMEKIDFIWYLKKVSGLAALGFLSGCIYLALVNYFSAA